MPGPPSPKTRPRPCPEGPEGPALLAGRCAAKAVAQRTPESSISWKVVRQDDVNFRGIQFSKCRIQTGRDGFGLSFRSELGDDDRQRPSALASSVVASTPTRLPVASTSRT